MNKAGGDALIVLGAGAEITADEKAPDTTVELVNGWVSDGLITSSYTVVVETFMGLSPSPRPSEMGERKRIRIKAVDSAQP